MTNTQLYADLDTETFEFIVQLRANNDFWFKALIGCAKCGIETTSKCIKQLKKTIKRLENANPNIFQICKAVQKGSLTTKSLEGLISQDAWHIQRHKVLVELLNDRSYKSLS